MHRKDLIRVFVEVPSRGKTRCHVGRRRVKNALTIQLDRQLLVRFKMAQCNNEQEFRGIAFRPLTKIKKLPAPIDPNTPVQWSSSDETIMKVVDDVDANGAPNGLKRFVAQGGVGAVLITVTADADLGEGVEPIQGQVAINVVQAGAGTIALDLPAPSDQTPPA